MELYHFCQTPLESGAVIKPGNWGRLMLLESFPKTEAADVENILFDVVLENVRGDWLCILTSQVALPVSTHALASKAPDYLLPRDHTILAIKLSLYTLIAQHFADHGNTLNNEAVL